MARNSLPKLEGAIAIDTVLWLWINAKLKVSPHIWLCVGKACASCTAAAYG